MNWFDPQSKIENPRAKVISAIERLSTLFRSGLWDMAKAHSLSPLQVQLIIFIGYHQSSQCTVSMLAKEFAVTKATLSDAVKSLLNKKLLTRIKNLADARAFNLELSDAGKTLLTEFSGFSVPLFFALKSTSNQEIETIWEGMVLLIEKLQMEEQIPTRMCSSCQHFDKDNPEGTPYYCQLMKKPLCLNEIRIDCPEHKITPTS